MINKYQRRNEDGVKAHTKPQIPPKRKRKDDNVKDQTIPNLHGPTLHSKNFRSGI